MDYVESSRSPFKCIFPSINWNLFGTNQRSFLIYSSGFIFALSWWVFVDGIISSHLAKDNPTPPGVEDYIVGAISTFGMIIVNSIDPALIKGESFSYSSSSVAWKARLLLFFGITCNVGALIGAATISTIKYYTKTTPVSYVGTGLLFETFGILVSCIILWTAQSMEADGVYNIVLS
ncbi:hypothetical protein K502DRAFT_368197 [Neoconidiobolus thromboides FSU 785]|nr:hypothetical protein K502DRAFT_368197 [Neoconidiobolus thromboides FSU 785]